MKFSKTDFYYYKKKSFTISTFKLTLLFKKELRCGILIFADFDPITFLWDAWFGFKIDYQ